MKRKVFILCILFVSSLAGISPKEKTLYIQAEQAINPYNELFNAISRVESGNNPFAYNSREQATGIVQIRPIKLKDFNRHTKKQYKIEEMFDPEKSKEVFIWHCQQFRNIDFETIARKWNGSGDKTTEYWNKVKSELGRQE